KAATRERMWRARNMLGGDANLKLLGEIAQLRREYAQLFGYASYADFTLRRRMAENVANTQKFLEDVKAVLTERELRDIAELRQAVLVANLDRKGLTLEELETLLHEFGHSLHNNLSATRYSSQAGTSVLRDFVEAPSQMLEDWVYDKRVLQVFRQVCPTCKPV